MSWRAETLTARLPHLGSTSPPAASASPAH